LRGLSSASPCAVAKWRAQPDFKPSPLLQHVLDTVLGQIDDSTRQRFSILVAPPAATPPPTSAVESDWARLAAAGSSLPALATGEAALISHHCGVVH
jgi:hypothetical protein